MKKLLCLLIILSILLLGCKAIRTQQTDMAQGNYVFSVATPDGIREYLVHIPSTNATNLPVIFNFHGGGGNAAGHKIITGMDTTADEKGFIVVYPQGTGNAKAENIRTWNAGNCCDAGMETQANDTAFFRAMVADLEKRFSIDTKRIYLTGYSNGAQISHRIACDASDLVAGIAAVAGGLQISNCTPTHSVKVLDIRGYLDAHVLYDGGMCGGGEITKKSWSCQSAQKNTDDWVERNGCANASMVWKKTDHAECILYSNCAGTSEVALCTMYDGGHTWPGGTYNPNTELMKKILGPIDTELPANELMWDFFNR